MKIRNSFVSNSSSSSYIINIQVDIDTFYKELFKEYGSWDFLCKEELIPKIEEIIESVEKSIKEMGEKKNENKKYDKYFYETYPSDLKFYKKLLEKVKKLKDVELTKLLLDKYYYINVVEKFDDEIKIWADTSMHNDFDNGMGHALKEIVLYFMFDTDYKVSCERIDTH